MRYEYLILKTLRYLLTKVEKQDDELFALDEELKEYMENEIPESAKSSFTERMKDV